MLVLRCKISHIQCLMYTTVNLNSHWLLIITLQKKEMTTFELTSEQPPQLTQFPIQQTYQQNNNNRVNSSQIDASLTSL